LRSSDKGTGNYISRAPLPRPGLWERRYTAPRGDDRYKLRSSVQIQ